MLLVLPGFDLVLWRSLSGALRGSGQRLVHSLGFHNVRPDDTVLSSIPCSQEEVALLHCQLTTLLVHVSALSGFSGREEPNNTTAMQIDSFVREIM